MDEKNNTNGVFVSSEQYNKMSNLFALAVSDVLMINLWTHEVNRVSGSCTLLIKTILQVNFKLFSEQKTKKLLFLLRDYDQNSENWNVLINNFNKVLRNV